VVKEGANMVLQQSACGYGDAAGFETLKQAFGVLNADLAHSLAK
jgi:hypothetical protein